jgi:hypothetical protein
MTLPRLMIRCPRNGQPLYTGIDVPIGSKLTGYAKTKVHCNQCHKDHGIRRPFLEGSEPSEFDKYIVALDVEPNFSAEVGVLISCFALIEGYVPAMLQRLLNIESAEAFVIMSSFDTFSDKTGLLRALVQMHEKQKTKTEDTRALSRLLPRITACTTVRNKYAHGRYSLTFNDDFLVDSFVLSKKPKSVRKSLDDIVEDVNLLRHLICDLHGYIYRKEMPPPSH